VHAEHSIVARAVPAASADKGITLQPAVLALLAAALLALGALIAKML
jgi:hypothetical protein